MRGVFTSLVAICLATAVSAQDAGLEARLKALEEKARDYDRLDARVKELEGQLAAKNAAAPAGPAGAKVETPIGPNMVAPGSEKVKFGGQIRLRSEFRDPADYRLPGTFGRGVVSHQAEDAHVVWLRSRLWFDAQVLDQVRAFVKLQDSRKWGEERALDAVSDLEGVDIKEAFIEYSKLFGEPITLRAGRFEMEYGDQRFVSPLDWNNVGRSWDGVRVAYEPEGWMLNAFGTILHEGTPGAGFTTPDEDMWFNGFYASCRKVKDHEFDLFYFQRLNSAEVATLFTNESGVPGELDDHTIGVRAKGKSGAVDYSVEGAGQTGARAGDDVEAWGIAATAGYTFDCSWKPRVGVEYDFASGDEDPTDDEYGTFDPLFPFGHSYQGHLDIFAWRNGHDLALKLSAKPHDKVSLYCDVHGMWLDEDNDAWYGAAGTPIRRVATGEVDEYIGTEVDLGMKYAWTKAADFWIGYSRLWAGDYIGDTGFAEDMDWFFLTTTVKF
ncbi:MAG: alginate export family protein [Planctomycetota bacterium]